MRDKRTPKAKDVCGEASFEGGPLFVTGLVISVGRTEMSLSI